MAALAPPVQVVASGAPPFVHVPSGAPPFVAVSGNAPPITIVASGAPPITLFNEDGSIWAGGGTAPSNSVLPAITGTPTVGQTLTGSTGTWAGDATITYAYQWKNAGVAIGGATSSTYLLQASDEADLITFTVTATNAAGSASATSASVGPIAVGGEATIINETNALGIDFAYPVDAQRVAVKTAGVVVSSGLDALLTNTGTTPKLVYGPDGTLIWTPHNLFINSETPATQSVATIAGTIYTVTVTGSGSMTGSAAASGVATQASPLTFTATGASATFTLGGSLTRIQMNRGATATTYLATAGALRVGVAVDYDPVIGAGMLVEAQSTNSALWSNDFTQTAWVKTNMTAAFTSTGPNGAANNASRLTATAANATALQTITSTSQARATAVLLKRITGSGNVDITQDNGSTWTTQTLTSSWARYTLPIVTAANPVVGIRIVTSGDAVDVAIFQHENVPIALALSSPIPSFGAVQTRTFDLVSFLLSAIPALGSEYSLYVRFALPAIATGRYIAVLTDATTSELAGIVANTTARMNVVDGGVSQAAIVGSTIVANTFISAAARFKLNDCALSVGGGAASVDISVTMPTVTTCTFDTTGALVAPTFVMRIAKLVIVPRAWSDAELAARSAT